MMSKEARRVWAISHTAVDQLNQMNEGGSNPPLAYDAFPVMYAMQGIKLALLLMELRPALLDGILKESLKGAKESPGHLIEAYCKHILEYEDTIQAAELEAN